MRGDSLDVTVYRLMLAHHRTGDVERALEYGQQATTRRPNDAQVWMMYAEVLGGANRVNEALRALDRVASLNPEMPSVSARRAVLLLDAGRLNESVAAVRAGIDRGEMQQDVAERLAQQMAVRGFQHTETTGWNRRCRTCGRPARSARPRTDAGHGQLLRGLEPHQAGRADAAGRERQRRGRAQGQAAVRAGDRAAGWRGRVHAQARCAHSCCSRRGSSSRWRTR
jgi:tetratricopeptide (TPR) repeat protein